MTGSKLHIFKKIRERKFNKDGREGGKPNSAWILCGSTPHAELVSGMRSSMKHTWSLKEEFSKSGIPGDII